MDFAEYRREIHRLYTEYLELWQASGGQLPERLPTIWRPQYERFELIIDLTTTTESILADVEGLKKEILEKRGERLQTLKSSFTSKTAVSDPSTRSDHKKKDLAKVIRITEHAIDVYKLKGDSHLSIAITVFGFRDTSSEVKSKSAERNVRKYFSHAKMLLEAVGTGTFFEAIDKPLPKK